MRDDSEIFPPPKAATTVSDLVMADVTPYEKMPDDFEEQLREIDGTINADVTLQKLIGIKELKKENRVGAGFSNIDQPENMSTPKKLPERKKLAKSKGKENKPPSGEKGIQVHEVEKGVNQGTWDTVRALEKDGLKQTQGMVVLSKGWSGGLAILWKEELKVDVQSYSNSHIDAIIGQGEDGQQWRLMGFYGNLETSKWEESWLLLKRLGNRRWVRERLDKALVSTNLAARFLKMRLHHKPDSFSNHCILVLKDVQKNNKKRRRKKLFRFEEMWLKEESCTDVVEEAWTRGACKDSESPLFTCLVECRASLSSWNDLSFGHVGKKLATR
ncbi:hypothetical protein CMV_002976 [Castanea mollissima]|uniref:Uncharacterized protein n=1 Tax=Castanea mollissima TaxID=60419 RepID=A0A8J4RPH8_9ROSI|nr:hypothetical protein CMV_002976 [Castanea mollissima]